MILEKMWVQNVLLMLLSLLTIKVSCSESCAILRTVNTKENPKAYVSWLMIAKRLFAHLSNCLTFAPFSQHAAFQNVSKVEKSICKYNVKMLLLSNFHCELNAIEGLGRHMKQFDRKKID